MSISAAREGREAVLRRTFSGTELSSELKPEKILKNSEILQEIPRLRAPFAAVAPHFALV